MKDEIEFGENKEFFARQPITVNRRVNLHSEAELAKDLIRCWAHNMVPDGETSAGQLKLRLLSPAEVAKRASETAAQAFEEFEKRGWIAIGPSMTDWPDPLKKFDKQILTK